MRAILVAIVSTTGCSTLLGITDPSVAGDSGAGGDGRGDGRDSMDSGDAPPPCTNAPVFASEQSFDLGGTGGGFAVADVNHDTKADVVVGIGTDTVVLLGDGTGALGAAAGIGTAADRVLIDDFDLNNYNDLVLWSVGGSSVVARRQNVVDNTFLAEQPLDGPLVNVRNVLRGRFDGNFIADLVVEDDAARRIYTANQGTPGTFFRESITVGASGDELVLSRDIDGMGRDDIVMVSGGKVKIARANPSSSSQFLSPLTVGMGVVGHGAGVGKVSGDAVLDLVTATAAGGVLFAQSATDPTSYTQVSGTVSGLTAVELQIIDANGDTTDDVLVADKIVLQCPAPAAPGTFAQTVPVTATAPALLVDLNKDGKPDLVRIEGSTVKVRIQQ